MAVIINKSLFQPMSKIFSLKALEAVLVSGLAIIAAFFIPLLPFILFAILLVCADYWTGTTGAIAQNDRLIKANDPTAKHPDKVLHSKGMTKTIHKAVSYSMFIVLSELMWKLFVVEGLSFVGDTTLFYVKELRLFTFLSSFYVCRVEYMSFVENVEKITGNRFILPFVKSFFKKFEDKLPKF